jgi:hypothetical protein
MIGSNHYAVGVKHVFFVEKVVCVQLLSVIKHALALHIASILQLITSLHATVTIVDKFTTLLL